ncbi:MAG: AMP-binding protein, partial [Chloroflexi bacterium]|nr:AMP-binding protein [Chloroflexota bacterium]
MANKREELGREYLAKGYWGGVTVAEALDRTVDAHPDKLALAYGEQRITYGEMRRRAEVLARGFLDRGLKPGDIVTVQMPNMPEFVYTHYALAKIGVITLPAIPLYRRKEMAHILEFSHSVGYVVPASFGGFDYLAMLDEMRPDLPELRHVFVVGDPVPPGAHSIRAMLAEDPADPVPEGLAHHDETACLVITGGTTGHAKGVLRTHNELLCHASNWARVMGVTPESKFL